MTMISSFVLLLFLGLTKATTVVHDDTFTPYIILRVTAQSVSQACINRVSVLVNGTSPGPEIRLKEGKTTWIRVYNDMDDRNLTMVCFQCPYLQHFPLMLIAFRNSIGTASPKLHPPFLMELRKPASGLFHHFISLTMKSILKPGMLGRISTTPT